MLIALLFLALAYADIPDIWQSLAPMNTRRSDSVAVQSGGFIYIGGGCVENQTIRGYCTALTTAFERYDIAKNQWSDLKPLPRERYRHSCAVVGTKIYFIHGRNLTNDSPVVWTDVYDITNDNWSQLPLQTDPFMTISDSAAFVIGNVIYVSGGWASDYSTLNSTIILNTADGSNQFKAGVVPDKQVSAGDNGAITLNGKGYVFGGFNNDAYYPLNTFEQYDPTTNKWTTLAPFIHKRGDMGSAVVGNSLFVIGGQDQNASDCCAFPVGDVEQWDSKTNTWRERTPISESRFRFTSTNYGQNIYNLGGQEAAVWNGTDWVFPIDNHVTTLKINSASSFTFSLSVYLFSFFILGIMLF